MKFYSVKKGRVPGIYKTWEECEKQILNFNGAVYKSFNSWNEAEAYLNDKKVIKKSKNFDQQQFLLDKNNAVAYSDGSYIKDESTYSYGAVVFWNQKEFHFSKRFTDKEQKSLWNVSGELEGAKRVMLFAYANNISNLMLYHDYEGIAKWATKKWKANNVETKAYVDFCEAIQKKVNLTFSWVKGHSGDKNNELADRLAAQATLSELAVEV